MHITKLLIVASGLLSTVYALPMMLEPDESQLVYASIFLFFISGLSYEPSSARFDNREVSRAGNP